MRSASHETPELDDHKQWQTVLTLLPYLWPAGERQMKVRVMVAMLCLAAAKAITVSIPYIYKEVIAAMTDSPATSEQTVLAIPLLLIIGYGIARLLSPAFGELREARENLQGSKRPFPYPA